VEKLPFLAHCCQAMAVRGARGAAGRRSADSIEAEVARNETALLGGSSAVVAFRAVAYRMVT
jgi:hypothetical protein